MANTQTETRQVRHIKDKPEDLDPNVNNASGVGQNNEPVKETESLGSEPESDVFSSGQDEDWDKFLEVLKNSKKQRGNEETLSIVCKIDSELAYTIDECKIDGASRSQIINAMLKVFIETHISELSAYRKVKKTLLNK